MIKEVQKVNSGFGYPDRYIVYYDSGALKREFIGESKLPKTVKRWVNYPDLRLTP